MLVTVEQTGITSQVSETPKEMISVRVTPSGQTEVRVNFSSLSLMQECWRKAEYSLVRGLRSNLESPATLFGSAIHKGLEVFYSGSRAERVIPQDYEIQMNRIASGASDLGEEFSGNLLLKAALAFVRKAAPLSALPPDDKRSIASGIWILQHYFRTYLNDPFVVLWDDAGPIVERRFELPIYEDSALKILAFGTIDLILKNEQTGVILAADHKTTSQLGNQFYQRLNPNHQYTFYTMGARKVFGLDTNSFLVNALQVKARPKTARGTVPDFARQVTTRTEEDFEELRFVICEVVKQFLYYRMLGEYPQSSPGPCSNYGGCQYLDICSSPKQLRETIIQARYSGHSKAVV